MNDPNSLEYPYTRQHRGTLLSVTDQAAASRVLQRGVDEYRGWVIGLWLDVETMMDDALAIDLQIPTERLRMWVAGVAPRIPTNGRIALI